MIELIAKAGKTFLGTEDHGIFTAQIDFSFGGSGQGLPGYRLDAYDKASKRIVGTAAGLEFIMRTIAAFGVDSWEEISGRTILVLKEKEYDVIAGLRPLPTERGKEFIFEDWTEKIRREEQG